MYRESFEIVRRKALTLLPFHCSSRELQEEWIQKEKGVSIAIPRDWKHLSQHDGEGLAKGRLIVRRGVMTLQPLLAVC
jgi:hypothetical protein